MRYGCDGVVIIAGRMGLIVRVVRTVIRNKRMLCACTGRSENLESIKNK